MNEKWYVGYFYHGYLNDVYASFKRHYDRFKRINGGDIGIWYPMITEMKVIDGIKVAKQVPMFENYILFSFNVNTPVWVEIVKYTQIFKFLKDKDNKPIPLTEKEVFHLLAIENKVVNQDYRVFVGKKVMINKGPFKGFAGTCKSILKGKYKAKIIVEIAESIEKEVEINVEHIELI